MPGPWATMLAMVLAAGLAACATPPPIAPVAPLLHDGLFGDPPRPAEADGVMAVDEPMRHYVQRLKSGAGRASGRPRALAEALYTRGELQLEYDSTITRNAAQAFAARSGNCLSLVLMTAALAREMGLTVSFQSVPNGETYSRQGDLTFYSGHVNLVLATGSLRFQPNGLSWSQDGEALQVDFLPSEQARGLRSVPIDEQRVLAMFMNNRAVESLLGAPPAIAYAWVREALRIDPGFGPAYNTLGVIYQRAGQPALAAAVLEQALAQDLGGAPAMGNLAQALRTLGRTDEAALWAARRAALEPVAPFHFLGLGESALARGDLVRAAAMFDREESVTGATHELYFQRARLFAMRGESRHAQQALQEAISSSNTPDQQRTYAAKLERLRALAAR